jgi:hypothetical protein
MMPSAYTMNTLPIPDDDRIALREDKEKTVVVIRYSGTWGKKRYEDYANQTHGMDIQKRLENYRRGDMGAI